MHFLIILVIGGYCYWKITSQGKRIKLLEAENAVLNHKLGATNAVV